MVCKFVNNLYQPYGMYIEDFHAEFNELREKLYSLQDIRYDVDEFVIIVLSRWRQIHRDLLKHQHFSDGFIDILKTFESELDRHILARCIDLLVKIVYERLIHFFVTPEFLVFNEILLDSRKRYLILNLQGYETLEPV